MADAADHYAPAASRMTALVSGLDDSALARPVAACPEWTVREVICHLTGVAGAVTSNNMASAFTGHRSPDQLRALFTACDPETFVESMSVFEPRPDPVIE
jgi:hypothetical protein